MKIFITLGLEWFPFDRLIYIADRLQKSHFRDYEIFVQTGRTELLPKHCKHKPMLTPIEFIDYINHSDIVVCHGGVGTVLSCLYNKKLPIVFPREGRFKEHVDNHQLEFCKRLKSEKKAIVVTDEIELINAIGNYEILLKDYSISSDCKSHQNVIDYLKDEIENYNN